MRFRSRLTVTFEYMHSVICWSMCTSYVADDGIIVESLNGIIAMNMIEPWFDAGY